MNAPKEEITIVSGRATIAPSTPPATETVSYPSRGPGFPPNSETMPSTPSPSTEKPMNILTRSSRAVSRRSRIPQ